MPFIKKKEKLRREKVSKVNLERHARNRAIKEGNSPVLTAVGRRVVDLALLASSLWCDFCDKSLSLKYLVEEHQYGLASKLSVRCDTCLDLKDVFTSATVPDTTGDGYSLYAVNCKAALGCLDSGVGHEQFNKLFDTMNLPTIDAKTMKRAEDRVGKFVIAVAEESCKEAIAEERNLTLEAERIDDAPSTPVVRQLVTAEEAEAAPVVKICVTFDFGWDKRGSGFKYDSHSGRGSILGQLTNKVLGYDVVSNYCHMCARGHKKENHKCAKNYVGSSKGMEPKSAVKLMLQNPHLEEAQVQVSKFVGDKDSSTMAALRANSPHPIQKIVDLNHNTKSINNALWALKKKRHTFLTPAIINYLKRCVTYAIHQNKDDEEGVKKAILNISKHTFGDHEECGDWCRALEEDYVFKYLPGGQPFSDPVWRADLEAILQKQAAEAKELAPAGSTQQNESFNHMVNTRAPKGRHYCGTSANLYRVSAAVSCKNYGACHVDKWFEKAGLTPSASKFRRTMEHRRVLKSLYQKRPDIKKRRLFLKNTSSWTETAANSREGLTYVSGMSNVMEQAAAAASSIVERAWMPEPTVLRPECQLVTVDIETSGFEASADVIQLAAKCGQEEFSVYILPTKSIHPKATEATGFSFEHGYLFRDDERMTTVPAPQACKQFVEFLANCAQQCILVGHNIISFDFPRILKLLRTHGLAKDFLEMVFGLTDTMPLIRQGNLKKQDLLAEKYLTCKKWAAYVKGAHDALIDCKLLDGLLHHFKVSEESLKDNVVPVRDILERQAKKKTKNNNLPALQVLHLEANVSKVMIGKMAAGGVTMAELERVYEEHGRRGLNVCFGVQLDGKPRVTTSKKIIDKVEAFLSK